MGKKALITGHFSTVGDIECLEVVRSWLERCRIPCDVAAYGERYRVAMPGSCDIRTVEAKAYTHLIVVCGPFWKGLLSARGIDLQRFRHCVRIGVNLTMVTPLAEWNPFDVLLERDSERLARPDLALLTERPLHAVVGKCIIQPEKGEASLYGDRQRHEVAFSAMDGLAQRQGFAVIDLDTRWLLSTNPLKTSAQLVSVLKRIDLLMTNRLHGLVFALKAGIPVIAVDSIKGGDKVMAQARELGWPMAVLADEATPAWMDKAAHWCLSEEGRAVARGRRDHALPGLRDIEGRFLEAVTADIVPGPLPMDGAVQTRTSWWKRLLGRRRK